MFKKNCTIRKVTRFICTGRREVEDRKQIVILCVKKCSFSRREVEDRGAGSSVETNQWGREDRTGNMIGYLRNSRI